MTVRKWTEDEVRQQAAECPDCDGRDYCFTHKMRYWGATPGRSGIGSTYVPDTEKRGVPSRMDSKSWEKGRAYRDRPGGFKVPVLDSTGEHMGLHEYAGKRSAFDAQEGT